MVEKDGIERVLREQEHSGKRRTESVIPIARNPC